MIAPLLGRDRDGDLRRILRCPHFYAVLTACADLAPTTCPGAAVRSHRQPNNLAAGTRWTP